jgi:hypothetical protein
MVSARLAASAVRSLTLTATSQLVLQPAAQCKLALCIVNSGVICSADSTTRLIATCFG